MTSVMVKRFLGPLLGLAFLSLSSCAIKLEPGWDVRLTNKLVDRAALFPNSKDILSGRVRQDRDAAPREGDEVLYGMYLDLPERKTTYYIHVSILAIVERRWSSYRQAQPFEKRLQRKPTSRPLDPEAVRRVTPVARLRVRILDEFGHELGHTDARVAVEQLQLGMKQACMAGPSLSGLLCETMTEPVQFESLTQEQKQAIERVQEGLAACQAFLHIVKVNRKMREVLREVVALPTLWSMIRERGIRSSVSIDFFTAAPLPGDRFPQMRQRLWSFPFALKLNDQPAFLARAAVGDTGSPDGVVAGVQAIVLRHAANENRRVFIQLLATGQKLTNTY